MALLSSFQGEQFTQLARLVKLACGYRPLIGLVMQLTVLVTSSITW